MTDRRLLLRAIIGVVVIAAVFAACNDQRQFVSGSTPAGPPKLSNQHTASKSAEPVIVLEATAEYVPPSPPPPPPPPPPPTVTVSQDELERRLRAAGAGSGKLQVSLAWSNKNDLDLHVATPCGAEVYFRRKRYCGLHLDVDRNAAASTNKPIENVRAGGTPRRGEYVVKVRFFKDRGVSLGATRYLVRVRVGGSDRFVRGSVSREKETDVVYRFTM